MAIAFRAISAAGSTASGTTVVVNKPTGTVDGDLMVALIANGVNGSTITGPAGWTVREAKTTFRNFTVLTKVAASEGGNYTFTVSAGGAQALGGVIASYSGATGYDVSAQGAQATSTTHDAPSVTAAGAGEMLICGVVGTGGVTYTPPGDMTERWDADLTASYATIADAVLASSGATGVKTFTSSSSIGASKFSLLLTAPAAAVVVAGRRALLGVGI